MANELPAKRKVASRIHIGTSGWHYPHWNGRFYPAGLPDRQKLQYYAARFEIVELNNTFYRLPTEAAVDGWREHSPADFRFAVKGSRFITHMIKLKSPAPALEKFFSRVDLLGRKMGPVLFQLPPRWEIDQERFAAFLEALPKGPRYAFEFRDPTWNHPAIEALLTKFRAAYCIYDLAGYQSPLTLTTDFTYIRLHGPGGKYQGKYSGEVLWQWANRLRAWGLNDSYVFFDNDQDAFAVQNAFELKELMDLTR